jgi:hypothetical protein
MAMGDLILFRPSRNAARASGTTAQPKDARILFFTGVRYMREIEQASPSIEQAAPPRGGMDGSGRGRRKRRS